MIAPKPPVKFYTTKSMPVLDPDVWDRKFYDIQLDFWSGLGAKQIADKHGVYVGSLLRYLRRKTGTAATYIPMDKHTELIPSLIAMDRGGLDLELMAKEFGISRSSLIGFLRIVGFKKTRNRYIINKVFLFDGIVATTYEHCKLHGVDSYEYMQYCESLRPYFKYYPPHAITFGMFLNNVDMPDEYC